MRRVRSIWMAGNADASRARSSHRSTSPGLELRVDDHVGQAHARGDALERARERRERRPVDGRDDRSAGRVAPLDGPGRIRWSSSWAPTGPLAGVRDDAHGAPALGRVRLRPRRELGVRAIGAAATNRSHASPSVTIVPRRCAVAGHGVAPARHGASPAVATALGGHAGHPRRIAGRASRRDCDSSGMRISRLYSR